MEDYISKLIYFIELTIPSHFLISIFVFISGLLISTTNYLSVNNFIALIISVFIVAIFNSFNGVFDLSIDKLNKPDRPLPKKKLTKVESLTFFSILVFLTMILTYFIGNTIFFFLVVLNIVFDILYSVPMIRLKERFLYPNVVIGFQYGLFPLLFAWVLHNNILDFPLYFGIAIFVFAFAITFTKDFEDYFGDKSFDVKTLPVVFGQFIAARLTILSLLLSYLLILYFSLYNLISFKSIAFIGMIIPIGIISKYLLEDPVKKGFHIFQISIITYIFGVLILAMLNI